MNLDYFPGQKVACLGFPMVYAFIIRASGHPLPTQGIVYTVRDTEPCDECGAHIRLKEITGDYFYGCEFFRPVDPAEMDVLRELLAPDGPRVLDPVRELMK